MKFRYLGEKDNMQVFGYDFRDGATPDVADENAIKRLSGNSHFEALPEEEAEAEKEKEHQEEEEEPAATFVADVIAEAQDSIVEAPPEVMEAEAEAAPVASTRKKRGRAAQV